GRTIGSVIRRAMPASSRFPARALPSTAPRSPYDSALTSAGAQLFFTPNWSLLAKFDDEFVRCGNAAASKRGANLPAFVGEERSYCATTSAGPVSMLKAAANRARV